MQCKFGECDGNLVELEYRVTHIHLYFESRNNLPQCRSYGCYGRNKSIYIGTKEKQICFLHSLLYAFIDCSFVVFNQIIVMNKIDSTTWPITKSITTNNKKPRKTFNESVFHLFISINEMLWYLILFSSVVLFLSSSYFIFPR